MSLARNPAEHAREQSQKSRAMNKPVDRGPVLRIVFHKDDDRRPFPAYSRPDTSSLAPIKASLPDMKRGRVTTMLTKKGTPAFSTEEAAVVRESSFA